MAVSGYPVQRLLGWAGSHLGMQMKIMLSGEVEQQGGRNLGFSDFSAALSLSPHLMEVPIMFGLCVTKPSWVISPTHSPIQRPPTLPSFARPLLRPGATHSSSSSAPCSLCSFCCCRQMRMPVAVTAVAMMAAMMPPMMPPVAPAPAVLGISARRRTVRGAPAPSPTLCHHPPAFLFSHGKGHCSIQLFRAEYR